MDPVIKSVFMCAKYTCYKTARWRQRLKTEHRFVALFVATARCCSLFSAVSIESFKYSHAYNHHCTHTHKHTRTNTARSTCSLIKLSPIHTHEHTHTAMSNRVSVFLSLAFVICIRYRVYRISSSWIIKRKPTSNVWSIQTINSIMCAVSSAAIVLNERMWAEKKSKKKLCVLFVLL